jgi:hypothetical protein
MQRPILLCCLVIALFLLPTVAVSLRGDDGPPQDQDPAKKRLAEPAKPLRTQEAITKGLEYLAKQQDQDGAWSGMGGHYKVALTALSGMALLMEGSRLDGGKYARHLRKAVAWLLARSRADGLICVNDPDDVHRYMFGHGFSVLFLSCVYPQEKDTDRRKQLADVLHRAVAFTAKAQTTEGGWGYVAALDSNDFDEGPATITQVQSLRAAHQAGIPVPKEVTDKAAAYLKKSTTAKGGVVYSLKAGCKGERPPLTAGAVAGLFRPKDYNSPLAKQWIRFAQGSIPMGTPESGISGLVGYTHYYYAQVVYGLGDDGYARLFPDSKPAERLTWTQYRDRMQEFILPKQRADGSWEGSPIGPVLVTAWYLAVLQLEKDVLPLYRR